MDSIRIYAQEFKNGKIDSYCIDSEEGNSKTGCQDYSPDENGSLTVYHGPRGTLRYLAGMHRIDYIISGGKLNIINGPPETDIEKELLDKSTGLELRVDLQYIERPLSDYEMAIFKNALNELSEKQRFFLKIYSNPLGKKIMDNFENLEEMLLER